MDLWDIYGPLKYRWSSTSIIWVSPQYLGFHALISLSNSDSYNVIIYYIFSLFTIYYIFLYVFIWFLPAYYFFALKYKWFSEVNLVLWNMIINGPLPVLYEFLPNILVSEHWFHCLTVIVTVSLYIILCVSYF